MPPVTFQVVEGIDKGRVFRELPTPVTIGREEGNVLRLNDERVSRFHAKVQFDNNEVIITDLDSTNGTRVNNTVVQIRRLRPGDRVQIGRSTLVFGSEQEIQARESSIKGTSAVMPPGGATCVNRATVPQQTLAAALEGELDFNVTEPITVSGGNFYQGGRQLPPLPQKMTPSQAARLSELLDFLHKHLTAATENVRHNDEATQVTLTFADWQRVLGMQMLLARYVRGVSEPDALEQ
jgi:pSer/pThr/pTyr-binding forkhead associated (FHA) protein